MDTEDKVCIGIAVTGVAIGLIALVRTRSIKKTQKLHEAWTETIAEAVDYTVQQVVDTTFSEIVEHFDE